MIRFSLLIAPLAAVALFTTSSTGSAQIAPQHGCADCHLATPDAPALDHVLDWDRSPHGRNGVTCSACHGGNPRTFERAIAHAGIVPTRNPVSPLNTKNLPATCGACHAGPFAAFQASRHYEVARSGSQEGPTCTTCHGDTDGRVLSAKALGAQCDTCHGPNGRAPREGRAMAVRDLYEGVAAVRAEMKMADGLIKRVSNRTRRAELTRAYEQAQVPLRRAIDAGHQFVYDDLRRNLEDAQKRIEPLLSQLVNR